MLLYIYIYLLYIYIIILLYMYIAYTMGEAVAEPSGEELQNWH